MISIRLVPEGEREETRLIFAVMTAVAFAAVGGMKSRFVDQSWRRWALETVVVAALADATGAFFQSVV